MKLLRDTDVNGKTILVRVDYNVPIIDGKVTSGLRIKASLPTIKYLLDGGAKKIILMSHLGRPEGKVVPEFSLQPVSEKLQEIVKNSGLSSNVTFASDFADVASLANSLNTGDILLLENLRFFPGEEDNSAEFAQQIVSAVSADLFVQDGFAVVHRAHASTDAITKLLPSVAGLLVEKEVVNLEKAINNPEKPVLVIIGGSKVEDKQPLIDKFLPIADKIYVGGKIAADGYLPPETIKDEDRQKIIVANDFRTLAKNSNDTNFHQTDDNVFRSEEDDENVQKLDIGKNSADDLRSYVYGSKTVIWNGVLGLVEDERFAKSSQIVAEAIGTSDVTSIICGGDTAGFAENLQEKEPDLKFTLVSTGGGAALEFLCGNQLPGLVALN